MLLFLSAAIAVFVFIFIVIYNSFCWGFILFKYWQWFILPVFTDLPPITFYQAVGLILVISLFKDVTPYKNKEEDEEWRKVRAIQIIFVPWVVLGLSYIIHLFI